MLFGSAKTAQDFKDLVERQARSTALAGMTGDTLATVEVLASVGMPGLS